MQLHTEYRLPVASDAESVSALIHRVFAPATLPGWAPVAVAKLLAAAEASLLREKFTSAAFAEVCVSPQGPSGFIMAANPRLLNLIVVEPSMQRQGIGTTLLQHLLHHITATAAEISVVEVNATEYSVPFYRRHSFYPLSEFIEHDGCRFMRMGFWRKSPPLRQPRVLTFRSTGRADSWLLVHEHRGGAPVTFDVRHLRVITHIFVAPTRGAPMISLRSVQALAGQGLVGDRYAELANRRSPDYQVTLIELENIEFFVASTGLVLTPDMPRRNIVTRGVDLNSLLGKRFAVGQVVLEGLELCEPCGLFAKRTHREVLKYFVKKGGLRARLISSGEIHVSERIAEDA